MTSLAIYYKVNFSLGLDVKQLDRIALRKFVAACLWITFVSTSGESELQSAIAALDLLSSIIWKKLFGVSTDSDTAKSVPVLVKRLWNSLSQSPSGSPQRNVALTSRASVGPVVHAPSRRLDMNQSAPESLVQQFQSLRSAWAAATPEEKLVLDCMKISAYYTPAERKLLREAAKERQKDGSQSGLDKEDTIPSSEVPVEQRNFSFEFTFDCVAVSVTSPEILGNTLRRALHSWPSEGKGNQMIRRIREQKVEFHELRHRALGEVDCTILKDLAANQARSTLVERYEYYSDPRNVALNSAAWSFILERMRKQADLVHAFVIRVFEDTLHHFGGPGQHGLRHARLKAFLLSGFAQFLPASSERSINAAAPSAALLNSDVEVEVADFPLGTVLKGSLLGGQGIQLSTKKGKPSERPRGLKSGDGGQSRRLVKPRSQWLLGSRGVTYRDWPGDKFKCRRDSCNVPGILPHAGVECPARYWQLCGGCPGFLVDGTRDELCWESDGNLNPSACGAWEQFLAEHSDKIADFVTWRPYSPNLRGSAPAVLRQGGSVP